MTPDERAWKFVQHKSCNPSVCKFAKGCGCVDAISLAIREAQEAARQEEREAIERMVIDCGMNADTYTTHVACEGLATAIRQRGDK